MDFNDVDKAFAKLIIDENHGIGGGLPRMKATNQTLDIAYLKGKLRLFCRTLLYAKQTDTTQVDLQTEDFSETMAILDRKGEYLAVEPALFLFYRLLLLLKTSDAKVSMEDLTEYIGLYDLHYEACNLQEKVELLTIPSSYSIYLSNKGLLGFSVDGLLLLARTVYMQYHTGGGVKTHGYLNPSIFYFITTIGLINVQSNRLIEINHVVSWPKDKTKFSSREWFQEFSRIYAPYLDPKIRKPYRKIFRVVSLFREEEYLKTIKIVENFRFPDNGLLSLDPLRIFYYCVFSLYYHGTPAERKVIRDRKLTPHLLLDRYRKRFEYQINTAGNSKSAKRINRGSLTRMQAIQKAYDLVYRSTPPANVRKKLEEYLLPIQQVVPNGRKSIETPWMKTQIVLLKRELEKLGF